MIHLAIEYKDGSSRYYPVSDSWRVDTTFRMIVIGRGVPRIHIPLDNVYSIEIEECKPNSEIKPPNPGDRRFPL